MAAARISISDAIAQILSGSVLLARDFYARTATEVARDCLGKILVHGSVAGRIVEVEAYLGVNDRAAHSWRGPTNRTRVTFGPPGHAYVYFIYGMHWCLNAVTGDPGEGGAVLLRAGAPVAGEEAMRANRRRPAPPRPGDLAGGPGKLCQALAVDRSFDGCRLDEGSLRLTVGEPVPPGAVAAGPRIGVAYAGEAAAWPLRFAIGGCLHVSRPRI